MLRSSSGEDWLAVADDGRGLRRAQREGNGLRGLRERVAAAGGTVEVARHRRLAPRLRVQL